MFNNKKIDSLEADIRYLKLQIFDLKHCLRQFAYKIGYAMKQTDEILNTYKFTKVKRTKYAKPKEQ